MPINLPDNLTHTNSSYAIIDATGNQVKGIGFFADTTARSALSANLRVDGYLAIVGTTLYKFGGGTWATASDWDEVGGATGATALDGLSDVAFSSGDLTITGLDTIVAAALTLDVGGSIVLDADGGTITFSDNGVSLGTITSAGYSGNAATSTKIASITNSNIVQLAEAQTLTNKTLTSPTLTTPALGTPASGDLANCTFPTLNQSTSGTASGLSATLAVGSGGTGVTTLADGHLLLGSAAGAVTTLDVTAKGSILAGDGTTDPIALAVGTNTHVLTADSNEASGLKWAAGGGGAVNIADLSDVPAMGSAGKVLAVNAGATALEYVPNTAFRSIGVSGQTTVSSSTSADTLILENGTGISVTTDAANNKVVLSLSGQGVIGEVIEDTTPQLGGDLDVNGNKIVSAAHGNIEIDPNGTGDVYIHADDVFIKPAGISSQAQLNLWELGSGNTHYTGIKSQSSLSSNVIITLPTVSGTLLTGNQVESVANTLSNSHNSIGENDGTRVYFGGTINMTAGKIYSFASSGNWVLATSDSANLAATGMLAVAIGTQSDNHGMLLQGTVKMSHDAGTAGDVLYLVPNNSNGSVHVTPPSSQGNVVRQMGYCLHSTSGVIYFNPSTDYIVVA